MLLVVLLVVLLDGVGSGIGSVVGGRWRARRRAQVHASTWASAGLGVALGGFGRRGGLGSLVVSLVGAWGACGGPGERRGDGVRVRGSTSGRHPRSPATQPNRNFTRTQTALRAREPRARTQTATRRNRKTKIRSQITAWGNSKSRRLFPDISNPQTFSRGFELRPCKPAYVP